MNIKNKLQELKEMHEDGLITAEVYSVQQKALLTAHMGSDNNTEPTAQSTVEKPRRPIWQRLIIIIIIVLGGIWLLYKVSDRQGKDAINLFASHTGIGTQVIPWVDRADTVARKLVSQNEEIVAQAIQNIAHPTGKDPRLLSTSVSKLDGRILVEMLVGWKGGFLGNNYETSVSWEISEANHVFAKVISDSSITKIEQRNKEMLDDYFRTKIYPAFYNSLTGTNS
jgi:hypothetical protein